MQSRARDTWHAQQQTECDQICVRGVLMLPSTAYTSTAPTFITHVTQQMKPIKIDACIMVKKSPRRQVVGTKLVWGKLHGPGTAAKRHYTLAALILVYFSPRHFLFFNCRELATKTIFGKQRRVVLNNLKQQTSCFQCLTKAQDDCFMIKKLSFLPSNAPPA